MLKLRYTFRAFLVFRLAFLLAGFLSVGVSVLADSIEYVPVPPAGLDSYEITNITFQSESDFVLYTNVVIARADRVIEDSRDLYDELTRLISTNLSAQAYLAQAKQQLPSPGSQSYNDLPARYQTGIDNVWVASDYLSSVGPTAMYGLQDSLETVVQDTVAVKSAVRTGSTQTLSVVLYADGYVTNSTCNCPDYTQYIDSIEFYLTEIINYCAKWVDVYEMLVGYEGINLDMLLYGVEMGLIHAHGGREESGVLADAAESLTMYGYWMISNRTAQAKEWDRIASRYDPWSVVSSSDPYINSLLPAYQGIRQLFAEDWEDHYLRNTFVDAFRDFYLNPPREVFVTNTLEHSLWVSFTNSVELSPSTISNLQHVTIDAYSTNAVTFFVDNLIASLSNAVLHVVVVTNSREVLKSDVDISIDIAEEEVEDSDPEEEDLELGNADFSSISRIGDSFASVIAAYTNMFASFPEEAPPDIVIWKGMDIYGPSSSTSGLRRSRDGESGESDEPGVDVIMSIPSLHYSPEDDHLFVDSIHAIMGAAWTLGFVWVFFGLAVVNLIVVRGLVVMLYATLLGDSRGAVKGFLHIFDAISHLVGGKKGRK